MFQKKILSSYVKKMFKKKKKNSQRVMFEFDKIT